METTFSRSQLNIKPKLKTIFWITLGWTLVSLIQFSIGYTTVDQLECTDVDNVVPIYLKGSVLTGLLAGTIGGSGVVFLWERWLRTRKYRTALLYIFLSYTVVYYMVAFPSALYFVTSEKGLSIAHPEVRQAVLENMGGLSTLNNYIFWLIVVLWTILLLQINDKYGPGVLLDFIKGKYFSPKREERIFMFLDLRDSTSIAERLGEMKYFNFLNDVFRFTTPAILRTKGEIYQYVGDEIVISWKMSQGLNQDNCVRCFYEVQRDLKKVEPHFQSEYNESPLFKAGLHYGYVMAGEIGVVKRDIVFSGDVLNTTARIQSKCNDFSVNILVSGTLVGRLSKSITHEAKKMGEILLRGKESEVTLYTI